MARRKTITLTPEMSKRVARLAEKWDVSEAEAMRRLFGFGSFIADELENHHEVFVKSEEDKSPVPIRFHING